MENQIEIYQSNDGKVQIEVSITDGSVWLSQKQISTLFGTEVPAISKHIKNIVDSKELMHEATISKMETVASEGKRLVTRRLEVYNLDMILSIGYRVNSAKATQFRIWATQRLKEYLIQGYTLNEKRLAQKNQQIQILKDGIRILNRAIETRPDKDSTDWLSQFARGLELLDDYDHEQSDAFHRCQQTGRNGNRQKIDHQRA